MRYQDLITQETQAAKEEAFRYAVKVPTDKLEWSPLDSGRTVLNLCRELALCPLWCKQVIEHDGPPSNDPAEFEKWQAMEANWTTVQHCADACQAHLDELFKFFQTIPDEKLATTKWLPFSGGRDHTVVEMMAYPRWNMNYHLGQIAYIQTLFGDSEMY